MIDAANRLTMLARMGFAARGIIYLVIAVFVMINGRAKDPAGALRYLGEGDGKAFLLLITFGLLGYGLWRLCDAAFNIERHGSDRSGIAERLGAAGSGIIHLLLVWQAIKLLRGAAASEGMTAQESAQSVLVLPGGHLVLIVIGLLLVTVGLFQTVKAIKGSYLDNLQPDVAKREWVNWSGRLGYLARSVIFMIAGFFFMSAGMAEQASEAGGMAEALKWLTSPWDIIVAAGLFAFGLFSLIEARYRIIHDVPVQIIGSQVKAKLR